MQVNEQLRPYVDVKIRWPVEVTLPLRHLLLLQVFQHHPRVLDAWVQAHVSVARTRFLSLPTVRARDVHVPVPCLLDQELLPELKARHLRALFARRIACLLILGEGGSGKTSLASQIGRWALSDEEAERPAPHPMLPVLVEDEVTGDFVDLVRRNLQILVDEPDPIPADFCERLLRTRRLLVIVDHLSELSEASRAKITPESLAFPVNALVITSRAEERLGGVASSVLQPMRLLRDRLAPFMAAYLTSSGKGNLFTDTEFHLALGRLATMAQGDGRDVTVLLATLYAKEMIASREGRITAVPESIPDLMVGYLNQLNASIREDTQPDVIVHRDAMALAWACVQTKFVPGYVSVEVACEAIGGADPDERLEYLERRLQLLQRAQPTQDRIRFLLDPLAEYLAGLWLIDQYQRDEALWRNLVQNLRGTAGSVVRNRGFLLALRDCCLARTDRVPIWIVLELERQATAATPPERPYDA
jgi:hypothetical protein